MKNTILFGSFLLSFFSLMLNVNVLASGTTSFGNEFSKSSETSLSPCNTPTGLYTTDITQTSAVFNWSTVSGAQSYSVQIRLPNGTWSYIPGSPFTYNTASVYGLSPGTYYEWRVRANCSYGQYSYWSYPISFTTDGSSSSCDAPDWLGTFNITQTTATWDWSAVNGAVSYSVQWRFAGGTWHDLSGGPWSNTWLNIGGLQPATAYEWRVRSNCSNGSSSPWSYSASFTTLGSTCDVPTGLNTTNITETSATFNWSPVSGAASYSVQIRFPNGTWSYIPGSPFSGTSASIYGLAPSTTYEWRVRSNCTDGSHSYWSYPIYFTTSGTSSCDAPDWLNTVNITQTTATLDWSAVSGAVSYSIQWRYAGGTWHDLGGGPFYNTWLTIAGLQPGTSYEWRVKSNCHYGAMSPWSNPAYFTTLNSSCNTPSWPSTTNITNTSATFNWSAVSGAHSYSVQIRLPNGTWSYIPGSPFTNTSATVYGLNPNTTYEWRVRANCSYGQYSNWTGPVVFTTTGSSSCNAPSWLYTANITQTSATFDWSPVSGAVSYSLQLRLAGGTWYDVPGGPWTDTWYTATGLTPGTTYEWRVKSNCSNGSMSEWSYIAAFTTYGDTCNTPTGLHTTSITESSATFNWDAVSGAQSYSVQIRFPNGSWYYIPGSPFYNAHATVYGLDPGTTYEWRVRANCGYSQHSYWSNPVTFTTAGSSTCEAPDWLNTTNITATTATWQWASVSGAISYSVQWRYGGSSTWNTLGGGPWSSTSLNIGGLQPGTTYEWRVRSNCSNGYSPWSIIESFTTLSNSCNMPEGLATINVTESSATFDWTAVTGAQSYSVQIRFPNGPWSFIPGSPFNSSQATVYGLSANTTYEWRVRTNCAYGQYSSWTNPVSFTTLPSGSNADNDACADATWLSVNGSCMNTSATNVNSTASYPAPMGGCNTTDYKDVWFRFNMPNVSNPQVTIRTTAGSLTNAVMEVYVGTSCSSMYFITCEDDNTNGNGSDMPVINLSGNPGASIWVRVWGHGGSTGTFDICVFNYQSNDLADVDDLVVVPTSNDPFDKIDAPEPSEKTDDISLKLRLAPNPADDVLHVSIGQTDESIVTDVIMTDMSGQIVLKKKYQPEVSNEFNDQLDISHLTPGVYILQLMTTTGIVSGRVSVVD